LVKKHFLGFLMNYLAVDGTNRVNCHIDISKVDSMFVQRKVFYSGLFTNLVGWHAGAVSFPLSDIILAS